MSVNSKLLSALCRPRHPQDFHLSEDDFGVEHGMGFLYEQFGDQILKHIEEKNVLDYGCRYGRQGPAYLLNGAKHVTCVDYGNDSFPSGRPLSEKYGVAFLVQRLIGGSFDCALMPRNGDVPDLPEEFFDTVIMINMFNHFAYPEKVLKACFKTLKPGGRLVNSLMRPWRHPYGCHMYASMRLPWIHLFFSEKTIRKTSERFWQNCDHCFTDVEGSLNRVSIDLLIRMMLECGFHIETLQLRAIKRIDFLTRLPFVREFFSNRINCILVKP